MYILLGYTYYCLHMYQEAIEAYNQDLKYNLENMASTHYHMGLVYIVLEQREKALEEYQILKNLIQNWLKNYLRRYTSRVWYVFNFKDCISNITFMGTKYTSIWLLYNSSVCCLGVAAYSAYISVNLKRKSGHVVLELLLFYSILLLLFI